MAGGEFQLLTIKGRNALIVCAATDRSFGRHFHDEYGVGLMESGAHRSASGRGQVEAGSGDVITVNPGEVHDGEPVGGTSRRWRMMYLNPAIVAKAWDHAPEGGQGDFEFRNPAARDGVAAVLLAEMMRRQGAPGGSDELRLEELLLTLLHRLGGGCEAGERGYRRAPVDIGRAQDLIDSDPARSPTLAELAEVSGLSRFQTLRAFARNTGLTPHAYLVQRRLLLARSMIARGEALSAAAVASGFSDQSHMSRRFVRTYGYTPGAYARALRRLACNPVQYTDVGRSHHTGAET